MSDPRINDVTPTPDYRTFFFDHEDTMMFFVGMFWDYVVHAENMSATSTQRAYYKVHMRRPDYPYLEQVYAAAIEARQKGRPLDPATEATLLKQMNAVASQADVP